MPDLTSSATFPAAELRARARSAMLLAAVGDALGWPQELRSGRLGRRTEVNPELRFVPWVRRTGGQFASHQEEIGPGEYSDDTQLILAVSRACRRRDDWFEYLTETELSFWPTYERGGGSASRRAAGSWGRGRPPWEESKSDDVARFFHAGGNGVAMRVLPHCVLCAGDPDFGPLRQRVLLDGIATHGHPRALVGALAYAFALWTALRLKQPLAYGALLAQTSAAAELWGAPPTVEDVPESFVASAVKAAPGQFVGGWQRTVREMVDLMDTGTEAMQSGALAVDRPTLERLGAIDSQASGAGTVTCAAALYLASRYASRPSQGLLTAAFAPKADTDTLASMTAALLGAVDPEPWAGELDANVQDRDCLVAAADALVARPGDEQPDGGPWRSSWAPRFFAALADGERELMLPDGRSGRPLAHLGMLTKSGKTRIDRWTALVEDGQTLFFKRISRVTASTQPELPTDRQHASPDGPPPPSRGSAADRPPRPQPDTATAPPEDGPQVGIAFRVRELPLARRFYADLLGLQVSKESPDFISFAGQLALRPAASGEHPDRPPQARLNGWLTAPTQALLLYVSPQHFEAAFRRVAEAGGPITEIVEQRGRRVFRCADPDGNVIELFQRD